MNKNLRKTTTKASQCREILQRVIDSTQNDILHDIELYKERYKGVYC